MTQIGNMVHKLKKLKHFCLQFNQDLQGKAMESLCEKVKQLGLRQIRDEPTMVMFKRF